ncbi:MAG: PKD domain-containing protein, partial [Bacteroidota bacterium]
SWTGSSPLLTATNNGPACSGANVQLNVTSSSGSTPIPQGATYSWTGPSSFTSNIQNPLLSNITSSMAGAYSVTVTANGCTSTATTTVSIAPSPTITVSSASICLGQGTATLTASGASTYSWSAGTSPSTGATVTASPGSTTTFTVTGTAVNNCTATAISTVTVNSLPVVTVNSPSICLGQGTATLTASGANSYSWSLGTTPSTGANVTANPSVPTNYTVTGTDANGCTNTAVSTVGIYQLPVISVNSPAICPGSTATLIASGASTYSWSAGTTPLTGSTVSVTPVSTEQFTVTGTDVNGCISSATSTVTINPNPQVDAGPDDTICLGNTVILLTNISPGGTATWNPGNLNGPVQVFPATATTTYTLSVIDANGCPGVDSLVITVPPQISLTLTSVPVSCNGLCDGQATASPSPNTGPFTNYNYFWQSGGSTNQTATSLCTGNYTVTVTNDAGCTETGTVNVAQPIAVTANASGIQPATCNGSCDGQATISANGGTGTYSYSWSPSGSGFNPTNLCAGNYTCTVSDGNNCTVTVPVVISQPAVLTASINPISTICIGQNASLTVVPAGGNGGNTFNWSPGTTPNNLATVSVSPTVTASYSVIVTDVNGCTSGPVSITVSVNPPLNVVAGQNITICNGQTAQLSAVASGGNGVYNYTWSPTTNPTGGASVSTSPSTTTTYTVTATDGCGTPSDTDQIIVNVNQLPVLSITSSVPNGCNPVCASFTANSNVPLNSVNWDFTDNQTANGVTTGSICFNAPGNYGASITVTDINNCQNSFTNNNLVTSFPVPQADFSFSPISATILSPIIEFQDQSAGALISNWSWSFGDPTDAGSNQQNPNFTYPTTGTYDVWLVVTSNNGCIDSINHPVVIGPEFVLYVPNAFTPNGDGVNDVFYPQGMGLDTESFELMIFDRWGNLIYTNNDFYKAWDGKPNGKDEVVMQDVYVWKITVKTYDGTKKNLIGHVSVIR